MTTGAVGVIYNMGMIIVFHHNGKLIGFEWKNRGDEQCWGYFWGMTMGSQSP